MFLFSILCKTNQQNLQRIQNKALRAIFYSQRHLHIDELHKIANLQTIAERTKSLKDNYLRKNLYTENPLITEMINEYEQFNQTTKWRKHHTLLDDWAFINNIEENQSDEDENDENEINISISFDEINEIGTTSYIT